MNDPSFDTSLLDHVPWPIGLWAGTAAMAFISWLATLKIFVSSQEHHAFKVHVAETYMRRDEVQQQLNTLHGHVATMQQQLQQMQHILYKWHP
jgi:TolA-binding protein